jgi:MacB-like periplasmic core domain
MTSAGAQVARRPAAPAPARLRPSDLARLAAVGLRTRKLRAALSALGIAIGVAAIVAVLGLSASSAAGLNTEIAKLGTNLLMVQNGQNFLGGTAELPVAAPGMIGRLPGVYTVQDTGTVSNVNVYRSPLIPAIQTKRPAGAGGQFGPACRRGHLPGPRQLSERRHGSRAGRGAGRRRRPAAGHRPGLAR